MTLAVSLASSHAVTVEQQWASFAGILQIGLIRYPCLGSVIPFPTPFAWVWNTGGCDEQCSLCVLEQRMLGWGDGLQRFEASSKRQLSCFIDWSWSTVFAVHQQSKTLHMLRVQWVECDAGWVLGDGWPWTQEKWPMHSILFANSKYRCYITSREWMEEEKCLAAVRSQLLRDVMNWNFSECLPWPKSNPQLWHFWLMKTMNGKNYHIGVHCTSFLVARRPDWYISWSVTEHKVSLRGLEVIPWSSVTTRRGLATHSLKWCQLKDPLNGICCRIYPRSRSPASTILFASSSVTWRRAIAAKAAPTVFLCEIYTSLPSWKAHQSGPSFLRRWSLNLVSQLVQCSGEKVL